MTAPMKKEKLVKVRRVRFIGGGADVAMLMNLWRQCLGINRGERVTNDLRAWGAMR